MEMVAAIPSDSRVTLGELSRLWDEPVERIADAIDAVRVCVGERTYLNIG